MRKDSKIDISQMCVDGGPTRNKYLMQFQSDISQTEVKIPDAEELSGIGAAYAAGISAGIYGQDVFGRMKRTAYTPGMEHSVREEKYAGWKKAVSLVLTK